MSIILGRLKQGDSIGLIAPAGPVAPEEIRTALRVFEEKGYRIIEGAHLYDRHAYLAGTDDLRLKDFHEMFQNPDVRAILCARGGYGTPRLLDKIDFDIIRENPKFLIGYSDITALLLAVYHKTGLPVCHGPMAKNTGDREDNLNGLLSFLSSEKEIVYNLMQENVLIEGKASGRLLGGNLSLVSSLAGTSFLPSFKDCILFLEDRGEPLYRIDRMLTQLKLGNALEGVKGVIAGSFEDCGDINEVNGLLTDIFPSNCPVYSDFPAGHGRINRPLMIGTGALLDTSGLIFKTSISDYG